MVTNLHTIANFAASVEEENYEFSLFLEKFEVDVVDRKVFTLNNFVSEQIDCTACGNCCRSLIINVEDDDKQRLAAHLQMDEGIFNETYIETSYGGVSVFNTIPCHFLSCNKCTVYEARPDGCRQFPHLDIPGFNKRLFSIMDSYKRCPIVFNVVEKLKTELHFKKEIVNETH